jgi:hypothetical protein
VCVAVEVGVVDVEELRRGRIERQAQQALLEAARHLVADVEHRRRQHDAVAQQADAAGLLDEVEVVGAGARCERHQ